MTRGAVYGVLLTAAVTLALPAGLRGQMGITGGPGVAWPTVSEGAVHFFVDAASFRGPKDYTLQEFYILLDGKQLQFVPEPGRFAGQVRLSVVVQDSAGRAVARESWVRSLSVPSLRDLRESGAAVRDVIGFSLGPGTYVAACEVEDVYGDRKGRAEGTLIVPSYEGTSLRFSQVLLASSSGPQEGSDRFLRHGQSVLPNTTHAYAGGERVPVYLELYNLSESPDPSRNSFDVRYVLADSTGFPVGDPLDRRYPRTGDSAVLLDSVSTQGLSEGRYLLRVSAVDRASRNQATAEALLVVRSGEGGADPEATESQIANLRYYRDLRHVAGQKDLEVFNALATLEARDRFLKAFWQQLDPDPDTAVNERLVEHIRRMRFADEHFSGGPAKPGTESDKGRVYVHYGPPADREYRSAVDSPKPFEIWTYDAPDACEFIFRDRRGLGVFDLVHSTCPGEPFNPNWLNEI